MGHGAAGTMVAGQSADVVSTAIALRSGFHESNPLGLEGALVLKAGVTLSAFLLSHHLPRKAANLLGYSIGAAGAIPAAVNLHRMNTPHAR